MTDMIHRDDVIEAMQEWANDPNDDRDPLEVMKALPAVVPGVRKLVWEDRRAGDYIIGLSHGQGPKAYMVTRGSRIIGWCDTEAEGVDIADKDNTARILAALEPVAATVGVKPLTDALQSVLDACDQGRMIPRPGSAIGGMTIDANIRGSVYTGVPAWPIEEAREVLARYAALPAAPKCPDCGSDVTDMDGKIVCAALEPIAPDPAAIREAAIREAAAEAAGEAAAHGVSELSPFLRRRILALIAKGAAK